MKKRATKNGFTLIELLAVIVILAIIALIAVPVILNILDKANKSAFKDTAYGIIKAGEYYYAASQLNLEGPLSDVEMSTTDSRLELKGNIPVGTIIITRDGDIAIAVHNDRYCVTKGFNDKDIVITENPNNCELPSGGSGNQGTGGNTGSGEKTLADVMVSTTNNCVTSGTCSEAEIKTDAGIKVTINVKAGTPKDFYVLADDGEKVTLIMSENLGDNVKWYDSTSTDNSHGPIKALAELASRTNDWEIPEFTYTLSGLGEDGKTQKYPDSQVTGKARLITYAEASAVGCKPNASDGSAKNSCPNWMYANLDGSSTYGYWASTARASGTSSAWSVSCYGYLHYYGTYITYNAIRPVIELSK